MPPAAAVGREPGDAPAAPPPEAAVRSSGRTAAEAPNAPYVFFVCFSLP